MDEMSKSPEEIKKGLECCSKTDKCPECPYIGEDYCATKKNVDALAYIQRLEAKVPKWISVEDRLPEEPGEVLMALYGRVCIAWYHIDGRFESGSGLVFSAEKAVTHWMPLPEPPKEDA